MSDEERRTVDGVPVKVGDVAWNNIRGSGVRSCRIQKHHLGMWWSWLSKQIYSTEVAAVTAAIADEKMALAKARREARRATKGIKRLTARLGRARKATP